MKQHCPKCGYTVADEAIHHDHHLCDGEIPAPTSDETERVRIATDCPTAVEVAARVWQDQDMVTVTMDSDAAYEIAAIVERVLASAAAVHAHTGGHDMTDMQVESSSDGSVDRWPFTLQGGPLDGIKIEHDPAVRECWPGPHHRRETGCGPCVYVVDGRKLVFDRMEATT